MLFSATVGDFNGDDKLDLVTNSVAVLINDTASATHNIEVSKNGKRHSDVLINSEGARGVFQVQDNGEGSDAAPDLVSDVFVYPVGFTVDCMLPLPPNPYLPIDGNVSVKP